MKTSEVAISEDMAITVVIEWLHGQDIAIYYQILRVACMPSKFMNFWMVKIYGNNVMFYEGTIANNYRNSSHKALP